LEYDKYNFASGIVTKASIITIGKTLYDKVSKIREFFKELFNYEGKFDNE